jgi:hypothetical protein
MFLASPESLSGKSSTWKGPKLPNLIKSTMKDYARTMKKLA